MKLKIYMEYMIIMSILIQISHLFMEKMVVEKLQS